MAILPSPIGSYEEDCIDDPGNLFPCDIEDSKDALPSYNRTCFSHILHLVQKALSSATKANSLQRHKGKREAGEPRPQDSRSQSTEEASG